ncbi:2-oxoglutarate dehydrogenase E1 component [Arthrobacter nitrophenolicus]|uniref:2-oxoglutarate dehydrogenase E1 component n=1 Tax=Arthrobacter nitrophenolicus TaxID=683150 RepID=A0A4R5Y7A6_9MICC|nr:2-oxoglutarate dehydrogenase E1 component [Arthrobacter nitrophenolicus]TDL39647.1 2-oxoglutarate dehydrogenase E1 component [Arthrobacter nitrophenolicus]
MLQNTSTSGSTPAQPGPAPEPTSRKVLRGRGAALARNMEASLSVPTASTIRTFEVSALMEWRERLRSQGFNVPIAAVLATAMARAAQQQVPAVRRRIENDGSDLVLVEEGTVNLGVAVDVETAAGHSIMVPVIEDAARLTFPELVEHLGQLSQECRAGTVAVAKLRGASLILTSTGRFGSTTGVPLLPAGPGIIVAAGAIGIPAGLEKLAATHPVDPVLTLSSTYDHRAIQGADSGSFLGAVEKSLRSQEFLAQLEQEILQNEPDALLGLSESPAEDVRLAEYNSSGSNEVARLEPVRARDEGSWLPNGVEIEFAHLSDPASRTWLADLIRHGTAQPTADRRLQALNLATKIDVFETYLQTQFLGQKTLSVQGLESSVLGLAEMAGLAAGKGYAQTVLGMAHRGRLSIMAHILNWPMERILAEFLPTARSTAHARSGDVRQHLGGSGTFSDTNGSSLGVTLEQNPSHLEFVGPVALGAVKAKQDEFVAEGLSEDEARRKVLPVLLHGDAAFTGQGVVYETFNLQRLEPYNVGGTIHIVQDNRLGFTATPFQLRSTAWPTDVIRGFDVPVIHTDADDVDANLVAARIAFEYRERFGTDIVIHVQGYRRHGHNETDEPRYTQPVYYNDIDQHPPVHEIYASTLAGAGLVQDTYVDTTRAEAKKHLVEALEKARVFDLNSVINQEFTSRPHVHAKLKSITASWVSDVLDASEQSREDVAIHPKLMRQFDKKRSLRGQDFLVDWGQAELLALKLINQAGVPLRLTGEDVERGTFSHRHIVVHDAETGDKAERLTFGGAPFLVANSPLTEVATVGFEYGYGRTNTDSLQLWEAQFGDFVNVAQVMFDQFIMAGRDKWGRESRFVALLPHGWEGAGPEHSSARLERFLQLAARDNARILIPTTAAQYFNALVNAAAMDEPRPHIVFTPKSLLRAESAKSSVEDFTAGTFHPVLATGAPSASTRRILLAAGKVGVEAKERLGEGVRLLRIEQLYPFPHEEIMREVSAAGELEEVVWLQEEPENMGAWNYVLPKLLKMGLGRFRLGYVGRPEAASPAEGYSAEHKAAQERLLATAVQPGAVDYRIG